MNIYYQGIEGSYSFNTSEIVKVSLNEKIKEVKPCSTFDSVWEKIGKENGLGVLPVENSYAGNVHINLYNFLKYDYEIIGEYNLEVKHCLLSKEKDIKAVKEVYAHPQALNQCYKYLKEKNIHPNNYLDNGLAAKMVSESDEKGIGAVASIEASKIYGLNVLEENIQDQDGNTTRFFLVAPKNSGLEYSEKKGKITIIFEARDIPSSLYKCLGAFATNGINLSKIESLPSYTGPFSYLFWLDFEGNLENDNVKKALHELEFFTSFIKVLGEY